MRLLLALASSNQHKGEYDLAIPLDGLEIEDILEQVRDFIEIGLEEGIDDEGADTDEEDTGTSKKE